MAELKKRHEFWLALLIMVLFVGLAWRSDEFLTFGNLYDLANKFSHRDAVLYGGKCAILAVSD